MSDVNNNPLTAGLNWRQGTCLDATAFTQYQAVKLTGPNLYAPCATTDVDGAVAGIVLADRLPGQPLSVPIALLTSAIPLPVLSDGSAVVTAGSATVGNLTLSGTVAGRFKPAARSAGILRAVSSSGAVADALILGAGLSGGDSATGTFYPLPTTTADSVSTGAIAIDGTILNTLHLVALSASATLSITGPVAGETYQFLVTNAGAFAITWPGTFKWPGAVAPTLTSSGVDMVTAAYNGTSYYASFSQAYA